MEWWKKKMQPWQENYEKMKMQQPYIYDFTTKKKFFQINKIQNYKNIQLPFN
jgi:hypothetical protein